MTMARPWFRWWNGCCNDPKFALVARDSKQARGNVIAVWAAVLERANDGDERGTANSIPCDEIAITLDLEDSDVASIIESMRNRGMIDGNRVCAWEKRQPEREREEADSTDRVRRHRAKATSNNGTPCNASDDNVTPCNAMKRHETPPEAEAEAEAEGGGGGGGSVTSSSKRGEPSPQVPPPPPPTPEGKEPENALTKSAEAKLLETLGRPKNDSLSERERRIAVELIREGVELEDVRSAYMRTVEREKPRSVLTYLRSMILEERDARRLRDGGGGQ